MSNLMELEVKDTKEYWSYYKLEDDTVLKFKFVLINFFTDTDTNSQQMVGQMATTTAMGVKTPTNLACGATYAIEDMDFEIQKEAWNEYKLENGTTLMLKPSVVRIDRTAVCDPVGKPIYSVQAQPISKMKI